MNLELKWLQSCQVRQGLNDQQVIKLKSLAQGIEGEERLYHLIEMQLASQCYLVDQRLLDGENMIQLDAIVIANGTVYVIEVKSYSSAHTYIDRNWYRQGVAVSYNPFHQLNRSTRILQKLLKHIEVKGKLVFINRDELISVAGSTPFPVYSEAELAQWLLQLGKAKSEDFQILQQIQRLNIPEIAAGYFYLLQPACPLKTGVYCQQCGNFELDFHYQQITCQCGYKEYKSDLAARMIDEYAMLYAKDALRIENIQRFTDYQINRRTLTKKLQNFKRIKRGVYENPYSKFMPKSPTLRVNE